MKFQPAPAALAAALFCLPLMAQAQIVLPAEGVSTGATAAYFGVIAAPDVDAAGNPGAVVSTAAAGPGGPTFDIPVLGTLTDESLGMARSLLPGTVGSLSSAGGFSPGFGPGGATGATSFARSVTHWQAFSADPAVTTVAIDVLSFFDGVLATVDFAGASMSASVHAELNVITTGGLTNVFSADAMLSDPGGLVASGPWAASFVAQPGTSAVNVVTLNYAEFFDDAFTVNVGEVFAWEVLLSTAAALDGPFETHAVADFFNTGAGDLSVNTPGITLVPVTAVPEPAAWATLLAGGLFLLAFMRRSRRGPAGGRVQRALAC
jgi:hypothetical protein